MNCTPNDINRISSMIDEVEAIVIGAGAGLSTSAGFTAAIGLRNTLGILHPDMVLTTCIPAVFIPLKRQRFWIY